MVKLPRVVESGRSQRDCGLGDFGEVTVSEPKTTKQGLVGDDVGVVMESGVEAAVGVNGSRRVTRKFLQADLYVC